MWGNARVGWTWVRGFTLADLGKSVGLRDETVKYTLRDSKSKEQTIYP